MQYVNMCKQYCLNVFRMRSFHIMLLSNVRGFSLYHPAESLASLMLGVYNLIVEGNLREWKIIDLREMRVSL